VNQDTIHEVENGINYEVKRETATAYFVVKPEKWTRPVPDGHRRTDDLCELGYFYHGRFTKGPPSYKFEDQQVEQRPNERFITPIFSPVQERQARLEAEVIRPRA